MFFQFEIIKMSSMCLSGLFEYLYYGPTAIGSIFTLAVRVLTLDVRF